MKNTYEISCSVLFYHLSKTIWTSNSRPRVSQVLNKDLVFYCIVMLLSHFPYTWLQCHQCNNWAKLYPFVVDPLKVSFNPNLKFLSSCPPLSSFSFSCPLLSPSLISKFLSHSLAPLLFLLFSPSPYLPSLLTHPLTRQISILYFVNTHPISCRIYSTNSHPCMQIHTCY